MSQMRERGSNHEEQNNCGSWLVLSRRRMLKLWLDVVGVLILWVNGLLLLAVAIATWALKRLWPEEPGGEEK